MRKSQIRNKHLSLFLKILFFLAFFSFPLFIGVNEMVYASADANTVPLGSWGGAHIRLVLNSTGGEVEYDCAFGRIQEPLLLDNAGRFEAKGVHMFERGGPVRAGVPPPKQQPALFRGWTDGRKMNLTVTLSETGANIGSFTLEIGATPRLDKCL